MTNQIAISLGTIIVVCLGIDVVLFDWSNTVFLGRKFLELLEWVAFWR